MSRTIDAEIWSDDWFCEQTTLGKLIWIGLITRVADDQGRFRNNPQIVKSQLFPASEEPSANEIDYWLTFFSVDERLISYDVDGKRYLQVKNWWKYQANANWMKDSQYPAPPNWCDWYKYQGKGGKHISSEKLGGVEREKAGLQDTHDATLQDTHDARYVNVNDNDNDNDNEKGDIIAVSLPGNTLADGCALITESAKLSALPPNEAEKRAAQVQALVATHGKRKTADALRQAVDAWTNTKSAQTGRKYSKLNLAWIDWAQGLLDNGETPWVTSEQPTEIIIPQRERVEIAPRPSRSIEWIDQ